MLGMLQSTSLCQENFGHRWDGRISQRFAALLVSLLIIQEEYLGMLPEAYRCFRNLAITESPSDVETDADSVFSAAGSVSSVSSTSSVRSTSRYRQRYGRGGRVYVDRTFTADEKEEFGKSQLSWLSENPILEERLKYDPRALEEEKSVALDEYAIEYASVSVSLTNSKTNRLSGTTITITSASSWLDIKFHPS